LGENNNSSDGRRRLTLRCLPITRPVGPTTTTVFQIVSPCAASRSRMGDSTTIAYFLASARQSAVAPPSSADSANSHHERSRVQKANGMVHASCRHRTLHPASPAAEARRSTRARDAARCEA